MNRPPKESVERSLRARTLRALMRYLTGLQTDERHSICAWANPFGGAVKISRDWPKWVNGKPNGFVTAITSCDRNSDPAVVADRLVAEFESELS